MSFFTSLLASPLARMYPIDKANHNMRGSWVAMVGACATLIAFGFVPLSMSLVVLVVTMLVCAAIVGALCAYGIGKWKESMDQKANDEARALYDSLRTADSPPFVPPHGVEVADWQFTAWGAAPVSLTLLVAAVVVSIL